MTNDGFHTALHGRRIAMSVLVLVGLSTSACTSSTSSASPSSTGSASPSSPVTTATPPAATAYAAMVDINTGAITPLPASIATSAVYYAVSPDHTMVAYSGCCSSPDPLFVANIDGTHIRRITAQGQDGHAAQWSPDGSLLVYQQRNDSTYELGNLFVLDMRTGKRTQITNFDQTQSWGYWTTMPIFAPDGRSILFQLPRGQLPGQDNRTEDLWSVPVTGGKQTLVRRNAWQGGYSPNGRWLAYLSPAGAQDALWITSVHGGRPRVLVHQANLDWQRWSPDGTRISYRVDRSIYVLNVASGSATKVAEGGNPEWFDNHTLTAGNPELS